MSTIGDSASLRAGDVMPNAAAPWWNMTEKVSALVVFLVTFVVYWLTAQVTVSFWDCGEFISCSYILGVPHPPGAPLFLIVGRLFSMLPLPWEVARTINLMSGLFNSLAIGILFLALSRVITRWFGEVKNGTQAFITIVGAALGAFMAGFGTTYWNNGLEAEVYGFAMLVSTLVMYIAILWSEKHNQPNSDRFIMLCAYLLYLGIGAHMTTLIMLPPLFLFFVIVSAKKRTSPIFWLTWAVLFLVATEFNIFAEGMISAFVLFGLAAFITKERTGKIVYLTFAGLWFLVQLYLTTKGASVPGMIFKEYHMSGETPNTVGALIQLLLIGGSFGIVALGMMFKNENFAPREWRVGFLSICLAILAFSLNSYTLIRSRANPYIDENDPETVEDFRNYMDRKQYGQESLWQLMLKRKGKWENQFGTHIRMGFWGFLRNQWANPLKVNPKIHFNGWLYFALAYLGLAYAAFKHPRWGALLFLTTLISTVGLLIYLNFSDGTSYMHLEVRDRDYFYTPGFMMMGALVGLGAATVLSFIYRGFSEIMLFLKKLGPIAFFTLSFGALIIFGLMRVNAPYFLGVAVLSFIAGIICTFMNIENMKRTFEESTIKNFAVKFIGVLFFVLPTIGLATYWHQNDRSKNYIPYDYGFNILDSVDKDGVIFTNGDNDTFPLWFLQAVPGVRTDVKIVNLSLLNTNWYIKQMKRAGVPITLTDEQIDKLRPYRDQYTGAFVRVQDIMVEHIVKNSPVKVRTNPDGTEEYYLEPAVFFAVTVAPENKAGYDKYLEMEGLVYRITTTEGDRKIGAERMKSNLFERYQYRGLKDPSIYKDDNSAKLLQNYSTGFITLALEFRRTNDTTNVIATMDKLNEVIPYEWRGNSFSAEFYGWAGMPQKVDEFFKIAHDNITENGISEPDEFNVYRMYFEIYYRSQQFDKAEDAIKKGLQIFPKEKELFRSYVSYLYTMQRDADLEKALGEWVAQNPDDKQFSDFYEQIKQGALKYMRQNESQPQQGAPAPKKAEKVDTVNI